MAVSMLLCKTVLAKFIVITMVVEHHLGQEPDVTNLGPDATNLTSWRSLTHSNQIQTAMKSYHPTVLDANAMKSWVVIIYLTILDLLRNLDRHQHQDITEFLQESARVWVWDTAAPSLCTNWSVWACMDKNGNQKRITHNWQRVVSRLNQQSKAPYRPPYSRSINIHLIRNIFKTPWITAMKIKDVQQT